MDPNEMMEFFYVIFDSSLPRLGPGDDASTARAIGGLFPEKAGPDNGGGSARLRALDIGAGNGPQTLRLAKTLDCHVLAVDNHKPFLDELDRRARAAGLSDRITTLCKDMAGLGPDDGNFDLILTEGALNLMGMSEGVLNPNGFRDGLRRCRELLADKGGLAVSELCWFTKDPPAECGDFFGEAYPSMTDVDANLSLIEGQGFEVIDHFRLPKSSWRENYLAPLGKRLDDLRKEYSSDPERLGFIEHMGTQIDIYRKYSDSYGYEFFMARKA